MSLSQLVTLIVLLCFSQHITACSCIGTSTVKSSLGGSDLVIVGKVIGGEKFRTLDSSFGAQRYFSYPRMRYTVVVIEKFKGNYNSDTITITTGMGGGDCGFHFGIGFEYVIYGYKQTHDKTYADSFNEYETNICTRTRGSSDEGEIRELRTLTGK